MSGWASNGAFFGTLGMGSCVAAIVIAVRSTDCTPAISPALAAGLLLAVALAGAAGYATARAGLGRRDATLAGFSTGAVSSLSALVTFILLASHSDLVDPCSARTSALTIAAAASVVFIPLLTLLGAGGGWVGGKIAGTGDA